MPSQCFGSFLFRHGGSPDEDAPYLHDLPSRGGDAVRHDLAGGRLYVLAPDGNALHRRFSGQLGDRHAYFLHGEFYERTEPPAAKDLLVGGEPDPGRLAAWVERLNGAFAGFIVERETGRAWAFVDRFGIGHVYVAARGGRTILASNLWPLLRNDKGQVNRYAPAIREILMFGYPLRDRTPVEDTRLVQPGTILRVDDAGFSTTSYHEYDRENVDDGRDVIAEFREVAAAHFESIRELTGWERFGSTLSGGHDSRVVVNAMLIRDIRPRCYVGYDNHPTWDSSRGAKVARACGLPATVFDYQETAAQDRTEANVLADGSGTASWTMNMGRLSAEHDECLYFGTSGDPVSGGWKIFPHDFADRAGLARGMMKAYYHEYETPRGAFLEAFPGQDPAELDARFLASFDGGRDLTAAFLINFYREGNFRRVRMFMQGAGLYTVPVHFFHDRRVYLYYSRLPYRTLIGQHVHDRLCYLANRSLGLIPASNFPIPVMFEPWLLPLAKRLVSSHLRSRLRPMTRRTTVTRAVLPADVAECLRAHGPGLGIDPERFEEIVATDARAGALALRARYVRNMLEPDDLLAASTLIGPKKVRMAGM